MQQHLRKETGRPQCAQQRPLIVLQRVSNLHQLGQCSGVGQPALLVSPEGGGNIILCCLQLGLKLENVLESRVYALACGVVVAVSAGPGAISDGCECRCAAVVVLWLWLLYPCVSKT